ncbi:exosome complex protein Rrp42 [archaeon]|nr:exosome complex protein Rrp42 [archaeon]
MASKSYITSLAEKGIRIDGRGFNEYRKNIKVEYGISPKSAEGSARVTIGDTIVVAGVKLEVGAPFPDKPDEGTIIVNAELIAASSSEFESGPPSVDAIELSRVVDRGIREAEALNFKKLCIKEGEKVWLVFIDIYPLNADGNLFDACALAALAALEDAKFPNFDGEKINYSVKTDKGLPLESKPVGCTVFAIGNKLLVDPSAEEENASSLRVTVVCTEEGDICAMQKGGDEALSEEVLGRIIDTAFEKTKELRGYLRG